MKMDLQTFAEEENQGQQSSENGEQPNEQPNKNEQNNHSYDDLNKKLSNAMNQFQGMTKKMTELFNNEGQQKPNVNENKPNKPSQPTEKSHEHTDDYEKRIANLEKQLQDQQTKSQRNDLDSYAKSQIKSNGFNADDDTFNLVKDDSKEKIDSNIKRYSNLAKKLNNTQPPKQPNSNNNGKQKQENLGAELAKGANAKPKGLDSYFK